MFKLKKRLGNLIYALGLVKPYWKIDRYRYLKRIRSQRRADWRYAQDSDVQQLDSWEVVIRYDKLTSPVFFYCDLRSKIEQDIVKDQGYQPHIAKLLADFFRDDSIFVDVGADIGFFSLLAAKQFPKMTVHAYEPNQSIYARLKKNAVLNGSLNNLHLFSCALADFNGTAVLHIPSPFEDNQGVASLGANIGGITKPVQQSVEVRQLDELYQNASQPISIIKIDVQGFEPEVLKGGAKAIGRFRPAILLEHNDVLFDSPLVAQNKKNLLQAYFENYGYNVFYISLYGPNLLVPVKWDRPLDGDLLALPTAVM